MVGGERTTCASTASSLNLRRANARRPLPHSGALPSPPPLAAPLGSCPLHCPMCGAGCTFQQTPWWRKLLGVMSEAAGQREVGEEQFKRPSYKI
jgi:hypothetical protein